MCVVFSIKAQNTFTTSVLKADSATIIYTRTDSVSAGKVRTDSLCSAKELCVHQDAKISGNVEVSGQVIAKSGIRIDTNAVGIFKRYQVLPVFDSTQSGSSGRVAFISADVLSASSSVSGGPDLPPIDYDSCESGYLPNGNNVATAVRTPAVNSTLKMWCDWWTGSGMIDLGGATLNNGGGLYLNYNCGKDVYIGWGFGAGNDWKGKANIRAKTWTIHTPQFCVQNTNSSSGVAYNGRHTFEVFGDGR